MKDFMTVVFNPKGTRQKVTIAEAILLIEDRYGKCSYTLGEQKALPSDEEREKRRQRSRKRYAELKKDPERYAAFRKRTRLNKLNRETCTKVK